MGWFDEQIKDRVKNDEKLFSEAFLEMSSVVMGNKALADTYYDQNKQAQSAINDILKYYSIKPQELPLSVKTITDQMDFYFRPTGIMKRDITLKGKWYKDGIGPLLATTTDGKIIALIPGKVSGYRYFDYDSGKSIRVNKKNA